MKNRPAIPTATFSENMSKEERFQNSTLRPILKQQHALFIAMVIHHLHQKKNVFYTLAKGAQPAYIDKALFRDPRIRSEFTGVILAGFTVEEYQFYRQNTSNLNKRMMNMLKERILSSIDQLVPN